MEAETTAYINAMPVTPDGDRQTAIDDFILGLKNAGIYQKLDLLFLLYSHDGPSSLINVINPAETMSTVNSPTFTADNGWQGNGVDAYLLGDKTLAALTNFSQNSAHVGVFIEDSFSGANEYDFGVDGTWNGCRINTHDGAGIYANINNGGSSQATTASSTGHTVVCRDGASSVRIVKDGSLLATDNDASIAPANILYSALKSRDGYSRRTVSLVHAGANLTDGECQTIFNLFQSYKNPAPPAVIPGSGSKRYLFGCEPERLNSTTIRIFPGSFVSGGNDYEVYNINSYIHVDLTVNGLNGLDTGTVQNGVDYFIYLVANPTTGDVGAVASASITYGGVTYPSGYTVTRKLPWGFVYDGEVRPFHLSGWPLPFSRFTLAGTIPSYSVLAGGTATTETLVDVSAFVPDNARMANILFVTEDATGPGEAYAGSTGSADLCIGGVSQSGESSRVVCDLRVTSLRQFIYKVTGGAKLSAYILGYHQTERS